MAEAFWVENVREERDQETGEITEYGDFHFESGKILKNRMVVCCSRCGEVLRPGSINAGEGFHIDGCE